MFLLKRTNASATLAFLLTSAALGGQNYQLDAYTSTADTRTVSATPGASDTNLQHELQLAGDYLAGRGVPRDAKMSAFWYRKAADQGDPGAQNQLGFLYSSGIGVPADQAEALKWYERAMAGGSRAAKLNIAVMYLRGSGVRQDPRFGVQLLEDLVKKNDAAAEDYLGLVYYIGYGVNVDQSRGEKLFERSAKQHNPEAAYDMGTLYSVVDHHAHDFPRAAQYLRSAVQVGYVPSMHSLGLLLVNHPELAQRPGEAIALLESAAEAGSWRSAVVLGVLARDGKYTAKNTAEAYRWFSIATRLGGPEAEKLLRFDLTTCKNALDPAARNQENQRMEAWLAEHPDHDLFVFGDRYRAGSFPVAEIPVLGLTEAN